MTFAALETSVDSAKPVELLLVSYLTNHWSYTNADTPIVHDGRTYTPIAMSHDALKTTGDVAKTTLNVKVPRDTQFGELFRIQPPSGVVSMTLFGKHFDDNEIKAFWKGRIVNVEWDDAWLKLTVENVFSSLRRLGLRRKYSAQCPHAVYGQGDGLCNVDENLHKVTAVVTAIDGLTVTCASLAGNAGLFSGGKITWIHNTGGYAEGRMVTHSDITGRLLITSIPHGLVVGATLTAYPGCDHTSATCHSRFNNSLNYGGMEFIPKKNPFGGSTLY